MSATSQPATPSATRTRPARPAGETPQPAPDRPRRRAARLRPSASWLPPLAYLAAAVAVTWPWAIKPTTTLMGPIGGDVSSSIAKFGALVQSGANPFLSSKITAVGFPDGVDTAPGLDSVSAFSALFLWIGSVLFGPIAAHGLLALLGFFLTATVTYLFVRRVTGSLGAALVAGVAYGFSPHLYAVAYAATTYTHMWLFVLPLWAFWNLAGDPTKRNAVLAGASLIPATFWTPYYTLHVFALSFACFLVLFALGPRIDLPRRLLGIVAVPPVVAVFAYLAIGTANSFSDSPDRPLSDFYSQAAHPFMFVFPGSSSLWGDGPQNKLVDLVPRAADVHIYVGLSVLLLAAIGAWATLRPWVRNRFRERPSPQAIAALLALSVVVVCGICSLPPRTLGGLVPLPASLIFEVAPGLRAGQRFVMPLMAGTAVLAGLGAHALLRQIRIRVLVLPTAALMALVVALDLYTDPAGMTVQFEPRPVALEQLSELPDGPAFEIFRDGALGAQPQRACFMQLLHQKPIVNSCAFTGPTPTFWKIFVKPPCESLGTLRRLGLKYVITDAPAPTNVTACFREGSKVGPARVVASDRYIRVFELTPAG